MKSIKKKTNATMGHYSKEKNPESNTSNLIGFDWYSNY